MGIWSQSIVALRVFGRWVITGPLRINGLGFHVTILLLCKYRLYIAVGQNVEKFPPESKLF
jgi:hypothetical protein